jgi:hypothetical protein
MIAILSNFRRCGHFLVLGILLGVSGCDLTGVRTVRVNGTVTRNGNPVPNLFLNFRPAKGRPSWGITDERGHYTLHFDKSRDGAVPGYHTVWATFKPCDPRQEKVMEEGKMKEPEQLREILARYGNPVTTPLHYDLHSDNQVINLTLD